MGPCVYRLTSFLSSSSLVRRFCLSPTPVFYFDPVRNDQEVEPVCISWESFFCNALTHIILIVKSIGTSMASIANNSRPKRWHCLSLHFLSCLGMAGTFPKYNFHTRENFVAESCLARKIALLADSPIWAFSWSYHHVPLMRCKKFMLFKTRMFWHGIQLVSSRL